MIDSGSLILGLVFGSIGLGYFIYGKNQSNVVARFSGIALMVYPYFVENIWAAVITGLIIMALPKFIDL